jgi:hypothetical protein
VATNSTLVTTNATLVATNSTLVTTNSTLVATNSTLVTTNSTLVTTNSTLVATNSTLVATNSTLVTTSTCTYLPTPPAMPSGPRVDHYQTTRSSVRHPWSAVGLSASLIKAASMIAPQHVYQIRTAQDSATRSAPICLRETTLVPMEVIVS